MPLGDRELLKMRHREEETVTGTYVTISAFQMGIVLHIGVGFPVSSQIAHLPKAVVQPERLAKPRQIAPALLTVASALATGGQTENGADMAADTALKTGGFAINGGRPVAS